MAPSKRELWFTRTWLRRGLVACLLWPLSCLFYLILSLRAAMYRFGWLKSTRVPVPVIVVGNIFVGGTGKTPLTIWLVEALRQAGYHPGVVSRGHGADNTIPRLVTPTSLPAEVGDEPVLIAQRTGVPLMVGRKRVAAAQALLRDYPQLDVIVADDGLQHYALHRDIEIVLSDTRGTGNGWLLPAGPLREPASRRRDFTVINCIERPAAWPKDAIQMQLLADCVERLQDRQQTMPLTALAAKDGQGSSRHRLAAVAGIGNPERFFATLRVAGLEFDAIALPDHFDFASYSFAELEADLILITEKDAVKCRHIPALRDDPRVWVVPVTAQITCDFAALILEKLRGYPTA